MVVNSVLTADSVNANGERRTQIRCLITRYLSFDILHERLQELPIHFDYPEPRLWGEIDWEAIAPEQVSGFDLEVYLGIISGAVETEIPIRGYTQTSRQYLERLHPAMAKFVGGVIDADGQLVEMGLWEKEERRHTPALLKIYRQLSGRSLTVGIREVRDFAPTDDPRRDLYWHGLHRIATEYGATCLYLWLMSHATGPLRQVWAELLRDEINHMTKFWGFGAWAFPHTAIAHVQLMLTQLVQTFGDRPQADDRQGQSSLPRTLRRMSDVMYWQAWPASHRAEFALTCVRVLAHLLRWSRSLTPHYLQTVFGTLPTDTLAASDCR